MRNLLFAAVAAGAIAIPFAAAAQDAGAAQPAERPQPQVPTTHGAAVPGMCTYSEGRVVRLSVAGQAIDAQLAEFERLANEEFQVATLQSELEPYVNAPETAPQALQDRYVAYRVRMEQIGLTEQRQKGALASALVFGPLAQAYQERGCSILFNTTQFVGGFANPAMDMTPTVVQKLDAMVPTWPQFQLVLVELAPEGAAQN